MAKKAKKTVKAKKAGTKRKQTAPKSAAKKKVAKTKPAKAKKSSAAKTKRAAVKVSKPKRKSVAKSKPKVTNQQANSPHPGMMGDGTEEQNLNQQGNPEARITQDDVDQAFKKPDQFQAVTPIGAVSEGKAMNRGDEGKLDSLRHKATINEKLDDALDNSFPARGSTKDEPE